jgi:hypothetical protein
MAELAVSAFGDDRSEFLGRAFRQIETVTPAMRTLRGPFCGEFLTVMHDTADALRLIDPSLTPEYLFNDSYKSREVRLATRGLDTGTQQQIGEVRQQRSDKLEKVAGVMGPVITHQSITEGALDATPYYRQGEEPYEESRQGCALAAFRMVFGGIAGWSPSEANFARHLKAYYNTSVVEDETYLKLFSTEAFRQLSGKRVASINIIGADLAYINKNAEKIKTQHPGTEVYAVASLASLDEKNTLKDDVWHKAVLLSADEYGVRCNDPSKENGGAQKLISHSDFIRRWVATSNSARLVIAADTTSQS